MAAKAIDAGDGPNGGQAAEGGKGLNGGKPLKEGTVRIQASLLKVDKGPDGGQLTEGGKGPDGAKSAEGGVDVDDPPYYSRTFWLRQQTMKEAGTVTLQVFLRISKHMVLAF